jgi:AraC-like DNA-binding protein
MVNPELANEALKSTILSRFRPHLSHGLARLSQRSRPVERTGLAYQLARPGVWNRRAVRAIEMKSKNSSPNKGVDFTLICEKVLALENLHLPNGYLAAELGCRRSQLDRFLQRHHGCSLTALRLERRLVEAADLLLKPGAALKSVAARCGFKHPGLFSVCFHRRFGVSPSEWSRRTQKPGPRINHITSAFRQLVLRSARRA